MRFAGQFSADDARAAVVAAGTMTHDVEGKLTMVWDCTDMAGYDTEAREAWQTYIGSIRSRIEAVHLVSEHVLIRTGARIVGTFAGIRIVTWASLDDLIGQV